MKVRSFILPEEQYDYEKFINSHDIIDEHRFFSSQKMEALFVVKADDEEEDEKKEGEL